MSYKLEFQPKALKEWKKLDSSIQSQFKKKLKQRLENPKIKSAKLHGYETLYKIKLKNSGYRLVYSVKDQQIVVLVVKIGKREKVYELLENLMMR